MKRPLRLQSRPTTSSAAPSLRRRAGTLSAVAALTAASGMLLTACNGKVTTETNSYQVSAKISTLQVKSPGGTIEVVAGDQDTVKVTETLRYNGDKPKSTHTTEGGSLSLRGSECGGGFGDDVCEVNYRVEVPRNVQTHLSSSGGNIRISGLAGAVDLSSDGGSVHATGITAGHFTASADGGEVSVAFSAVPDRVDLNSAGGNVTAQLPNSSYAVDASTDGGTSKVRVRTDPSSAHRVRVHTEGGDITLSPTS